MLQFLVIRGGMPVPKRKYDEVVLNDDEPVADAQQDSDSFAARFAFGFREVKPITEQQLAASRVKRSMAQERKQLLVAGPQPDNKPMPVPPMAQARYRSPKQFMDEALKYLEPTEVGPAFAQAFLTALQEKDAALLKLFLPYVFGVLPKEAESQQVGVVFGELLQAIKEPPVLNAALQREKGRKHSLAQVASNPFVLEEGGEDE